MVNQVYRCKIKIQHFGDRHSLEAAGLVGGLHYWMQRILLTCFFYKLYVNKLY